MDSDLESSWEHQQGASVYNESQYSVSTSNFTDATRNEQDLSRSLGNLNLTHNHSSNSTSANDTSAQSSVGSMSEIADGVDRLYDDDFDGMLDDLNRELPPHACR
jgi:hypothetical protein